MANTEKVCGPCIQGGHDNCLNIFWRQLSGSSCGCVKCRRERGQAAWTEDEQEDA